MNIPIKGLLQQMKNEIHAAERKATLEEEHGVREHVRALKSLCELILQSEKDESVSVQPTSTPSSDTNFQQHLHMMEYGKAKPASPVNPQVTKPLEGKKIEEDDANGDSLFDF